MALADLIARLERDAEARLAEREASAAAEVEVLRVETREVATKRRELELGKRRAARRARLDAELAEARRESRSALSSAQHALLARVFARARELLPEAGQSREYLEQLPGHLAEARRYLEGVPVVVRCHPSSRAQLGAELEVVEDATLAPGVVLAAKDGSVTIDATLLARLERAQPRLAVELIAAMRGGPPC